MRVPRLGPNETKAYTALLFLEHALKKNKFDKGLFEKAKVEVGSRLRESWKDKSVDLNFLESLVPADDTELLGLMGLAERLAPLLLQASAVQSNPRLIKRFLNTVFLRKALATPQGIDVDVQVLAKWHLLERCDEAVANALADKVSANTDGRVGLLNDAEAMAGDVAAKLPAPFGDQPFIKEWLQLPPKLGDFDLRPVLHLSRDSTIRDFGADELNQLGKQLRDGLVAARSSSNILREQIKAAGEPQAIIAMTRAWGQRTSSRTWQKAEEVLMLVEVCATYPEAANRAATLLAGAPAAQLAPAFAHALLASAWAKGVLDDWEKHEDTPAQVKRAIAQGRT